MPFARCRFYDENGEAIRDGCRRKGESCNFIHPGEPNWAKAPLSSLKLREKNNDSVGFKPRSERNTGGPLASSPQETSAVARGGSTDTGGGWDTGNAWGTGTDGGWDTGGNGGGWGARDSTSTAGQAPESAQPTSSSNPWGTSPRANNQTRANSTPAASDNSVWGSGSDNGSSWGNDKVADAWGSAENNGWEASGNNGWGQGWGSSENKTTGAEGESNTTTAVNQPEKEVARDKGKGKAVLAPPRIRIPDSGKNLKITGTNNVEPLTASKQWGGPHSSNVATVPAILTPIAVSTPTDSISVKRKRDVAFDDKYELFKECIKAWERAIRAQYMFNEIETRRNCWRRTQKSACYTRIGGAGRKRLDDQRLVYDDELRSQGQKLRDAIASLAEYHDTNTFNFDFGRRYDFGAEAEKYVSESKAFRDEIHAILVTRVLEDKESMQIDGVQKQPLGADPSFLDTLGSKIRDLEERFEQAQTELTLRRQHDVRQEVDQILTAKIDALRVARHRAADRAASQPRPEIDMSPGAIKSLEGAAEQANVVATKVSYAAEDLGALLLRIDAVAKRVSELEREVSTNKEVYQQQVQNMAAERERTEARIDKQLRIIQERFEQLAVPRSVSPIARETQDEMMKSLVPALETILDEFYGREIQPTIESLRRVVVETSNRHQEDAIKVLWGKIQPAMNMVEGVSQWLDSQELGVTAPV